MESMKEWANKMTHDISESHQKIKNAHHNKKEAHHNKQQAHQEKKEAHHQKNMDHHGQKEAHLNPEKLGKAIAKRFLIVGSIISILSHAFILVCYAYIFKQYVEACLTFKEKNTKYEENFEEKDDTERQAICKYVSENNQKTKARQQAKVAEKKEETSTPVAAMYIPPIQAPTGLPATMPATSQPSPYPTLVTMSPDFVGAAIIPDHLSIKRQQNNCDRKATAPQQATYTLDQVKQLIAMERERNQF